MRVRAEFDNFFFLVWMHVLYMVLVMPLLSERLAANSAHEGLQVIVDHHVVPSIPFFQKYFIAIKTTKLFFFFVYLNLPIIQMLIYFLLSKKSFGGHISIFFCRRIRSLYFYSFIEIWKFILGLWNLDLQNFRV